MKEVLIITMVGEFVANLIVNKLCEQKYCQDMYLEVKHNNFGSYDVVAQSFAGFKDAGNLVMAKEFAAGMYAGYNAPREHLK